MKQKILSFILVLVFTFSLSSTAFAADSGEPAIYGKAAVTIDMKTGEIIYTKDIDRPHMYPASTTKMMTALLLAENKKKTDMITYTQSGKTQPEYSLNLDMHPMTVGDTMTAEAAMDALLLYSANDIAYVIADNVAGSTDKFVQMMNDKAKEMGLTGTHFVTPNGIDNGIDDHYTTPYELAKIGMEAFKNPWVRETMGTKTSKFTTTSGIVLNLENRNKLLGQDGNIGGKTGYTAKAGRCLVAFYNRNGREIMGVVMDSVYDSKDSYVFNDMKKIIDWSYSAQRSSYKKSGDVVKTVDVTYKQFKYFGSKKTVHIPVVIKNDINIYNNEVNPKEIKEEFNISPIDIWKLNKDTSIGTMIVKQRNSTQSYKLYSQVSSGDVLKGVLPMLIGICVAGIVLVLLLVILFIKIAGNRKRRRRKYY